MWLKVACRVFNSGGAVGCFNEAILFVSGAGDVLCYSCLPVLQRAVIQGCNNTGSKTFIIY